MANMLRPIEEPYPEAVADILARYPQENGYILKIFGVFANSVRFLAKGMPNLLDKDSPLSLRTREIVILRVTASRNCEYEWGVHVAIFSKHAGLSEGQIADTRNEVLTSADWTETDRVVISAIDQLLASGQMDRPILTQFRAEFSPEEQLEICALAGAYQTVSFVANIAQIDGEPFGAKFPDQSSA